MKIKVTSRITDLQMENWSNTYIFYQSTHHCTVLSVILPYIWEHESNFDMWQRNRLWALAFATNSYIHILVQTYLRMVLMWGNNDLWASCATAAAAAATNSRRRRQEAAWKKFKPTLWRQSPQTFATTDKRCGGGWPTNELCSV